MNHMRIGLLMALALLCSTAIAADLVIEVEAGKHDLMSNRPLAVCRDARHRPTGIAPEQSSAHCEQLLQLRGSAS